MTTANQGMSVKEIEKIVAQRVANAIETIAIYETKTRIAQESISQTKQQEKKVAGNASNKRKREVYSKKRKLQESRPLVRDGRSPATTNNQRIITCYKYGNQGHYRRDCPELKNQNHGNQAGDTEARGLMYALGRGEIDQDPKNMEVDINA
ncbi:reverse transcriptase domain-containing protein [Tanacetum coccineum]